MSLPVRAQAPLKVNRSRFSVPLKCRKCGRVGVATWEENTDDNLAAGRQSSLESVSWGFFQQIPASHRGNSEIVCENCNTIQLG